MRVLQAAVFLVLGSLITLTLRAQAPPVEIDFAPVPNLQLGTAPLPGAAGAYSLHWLTEPGMQPPQNSVHVATIVGKKINCTEPSTPPGGGGGGKQQSTGACDYPIDVWKIQ